ncbi:hypothetical protein FH972_010303 [Carpinus fangiana]|uniref:Uncharacterized protein n=1 Tax=Carpinus fangiana TaxID=176857 RepID=A0A660KTZ2_9ROSI|nr:hypothetical protein FH972_010303 [Carpinus fangiana]
MASLCLVVKDLEVVFGGAKEVKFSKYFFYESRDFRPRIAIFSVHITRGFMEDLECRGERLSMDMWLHGGP